MSRVPAGLRREIDERAGGRCEYCRSEEKLSPVRFHCEHILPVQHGGGMQAENLALACPACNFRKGTNLTGIDPDSEVVVALFHPRRDRWEDHFEDQAGRIVAKTAAGWATARLLGFNAAERVAARVFERTSSER